MNLKAVVDTAFGSEEHIAEQVKVDQSGVLAIGSGKDTHLYAPTYWLHVYVSETDEQEPEPKEATVEDSNV